MEPPGRRGDPSRQAAAVRELRQEVGRLRARIDQHEREHAEVSRRADHEARDRAASRRSTRRYVVTMGVTVVTSNLATVLIVALAHGHA